jgi:hypothetical protein
MKKRLIVGILIVVFVVGCSTNKNFNEDKFEDYVPWWAVTNVSIVTNFPINIHTNLTQDQTNQTNQTNRVEVSH